MIYFLGDETSASILRPADGCGGSSRATGGCLTALRPWAGLILVSLLTSIFLSLWGLLFMVPYMVVMILAALLGSMGLMMLAILLLIGGMVMMVIFSYRYRLATYFLLDHPEMGALESITQSKQAMKGWKGELFILDWSFFGWLLLVALVELVGIGLGTLFSPALGTLLGTVAAGAFSLWLNPYMNGTEANFYDWVTHGSLSYRENNGPGGYQTPTEQHSGTIIKSSLGV